jgi:hypothetical protein
MLYIVRLTFPDLEFVLDPIAVPSIDLSASEPTIDSGQGVVALVGRNVLSNLNIEWHGPDGIWSIST